MTKTEATAEVFWTAFRCLDSAQRHAVLARLVRDRGVRKDLLDVALIQERRDEPARPFRKYLAARRDS